MLVAGFPAAAFGTNCYVVAAAAGERCVVVDPGVGVAEYLDEVLSTHRLEPAAVLLTHGHIDHTFSVTPVCGANDVPAYIHPDDADLLSDPARGFGPAIEQMFAAGLDWTEPADVRPLPDGGSVQIAGMAITVDHAPGHTRGSVLFRLPDAEDSRDLVLSGDVLFAGSIGRTDLPGGDYTAMMRSLATKILPLADETVVLPGHGPRTTIGRERTSNPYLAEAA
ncbi:MAG TPA: MBL fold metallo-hydrolase, partial [Actinomycetes bacterium]|nr:MBL fold metallo-hydrolase [Actinomycetes bacterium]